MRPLEGITILDLTGSCRGPTGPCSWGTWGPRSSRSRNPGRGITPAGIRRTSIKWVAPSSSQPGQEEHHSQSEKPGRTIHSSEDGRERGRRSHRAVSPRSDGSSGGRYKALEKVNSRLIYCSLTGFGQDGPYRDLAGHDINYIGIGGSLYHGASKRPARHSRDPDCRSGGGGSLLGDRDSDRSHGPAEDRPGSICGYLHAGRGRILDSGRRRSLFCRRGISSQGERRLTGGLPQYQTYRTRDGKYLAVGALEDKFWANLSRALGKPEWAHQVPKEREPRTQEIKEEMTRIFLTRTRQEWLDILMKEDTCVTAVHTLEETFSDPMSYTATCWWRSNTPKPGGPGRLDSPSNFPKLPVQFGPQPRKWRTH